ncbi:TetR/AcrR family transcriptional regulator [Roseovarius sp. TE539]|uniref:TetR/AcrR family transcriptional regulator n=1 Tax=Roseovarius sp. TE539 TaxID=2249812 RepID=UPI000DDED5FD|nr:TetR/AcrR family transcriptional regulator [Roseovarius sp. TE539]RBI69860.1 TetR/AcrR family transcriptional regulator [Roseovarius sp. TE539]
MGEMTATDASGPVAGRSARAEASRQEILAAAAGMMRRNGYAEMSLRDVAARVHKKAGSLYYHFASKEDLAAEVMRIGVEAVETDVRATLAGLGEEASAETRLNAAIEVHLETLLKRSDFVSSHIRCYPFVPESVRAELREARRRYDRLWLELIGDFAGPATRAVEVHYIRHILVGALNQSLEWFNPNRDPIEDFAGQLHRMLLGLKGRQAR